MGINFSKSSDVSVLYDVLGMATCSLLTAVTRHLLVTPFVVVTPSHSSIIVVTQFYFSSVVTPSHSSLVLPIVVTPSRFILS